MAERHGRIGEHACISLVSGYSVLAREIANFRGFAACDQRKSAYLSSKRAVVALLLICVLI